MRCVVKSAIALVCLTTLAVPATAQGNCSLQSAVGTDAAVVTGYLGTTPYVALGTSKVDAQGTSTAKVTIVSPNGSYDQATTGKVVVDSDCTITKYYPSFTEQGVILRNGEETRMMLHDPLVTPLGPRVQTGVGYRMAAGANEPRCGPSMLVGTYGQYCNSWIVAGPTKLPSAFLGRITFDGAGGFTGGGIITVGGNKLPVTYEDGAYTLNQDCTGGASFKIAGQPGTWTEKTVSFDQGKEIISVTTSGQETGVCRFTRLDR